MIHPECDFGTPIELSKANDGDIVRWWTEGLAQNMASDKHLQVSKWSDLLGIIVRNENRNDLVAVYNDRPLGPVLAKYVVVLSG